MLQKQAKKATKASNCSVRLTQGDFCCNDGIPPMWIQLRLVADKQTDRRTRDDSKYCANSVAWAKITFEGLQQRMTLNVIQGHRNCL